MAMCGSRAPIHVARTISLGVGFSAGVVSPVKGPGEDVTGWCMWTHGDSLDMADSGLTPGVVTAFDAILWFSFVFCNFRPSRTESRQSRRPLLDMYVARSSGSAAE